MSGHIFRDPEKVMFDESKYMPAGSLAHWLSTALNTRSSSIDPFGDTGKGMLAACSMSAVLAISKQWFTDVVRGVENVGVAWVSHSQWDVVQYPESEIACHMNYTM